MNKTIKPILGIVITFIVLALSGAIEMGFSTVFESIPMGVSSQLGILIISLTLIFIFTKKHLIKFNVEKINKKQLFYSVAITLFLVGIRQLLSGIVETEEHPIATSMSVAQQLFFIVILASLSEELLFRGFLQNMLSPLKSFSIHLFNLRLSAPVLISGIFFGLIHFALLSTGASFIFVIIIVISAMALGMIAGYFQEKNNNFSYAFVVHLTANLAGLIISLL